MTQTLKILDFWNAYINDAQNQPNITDYCFVVFCGWLWRFSGIFYRPIDSTNLDHPTIDRPRQRLIHLLTSRLAYQYSLMLCLIFHTHQAVDTLMYSS